MADEIVKTVDLKAPVDRVWRAITDKDEFGAWFRVNLDAPFEAGQPSTGRMTYPGYEHVQWSATVVDMIEPHLFSYTWRPYALDPDVDYSAEAPTLVEFRLEPWEGGTRLTVRESGFGRVPEDRRAEAFRMNEQGWTTQVENIRRHVHG
jgi:uncharacterized protein YndB with AHSA1/START domain